MNRWVERGYEPCVYPRTRNREPGNLFFSKEVELGLGGNRCILGVRPKSMHRAGERSKKRAEEFFAAAASFLLAGSGVGIIPYQAPNPSRPGTMAVKQHKGRRSSTVVAGLRESTAAPRAERCYPPQSKIAAAPKRVQNAIGSGTRRRPTR